MRLSFIIPAYNVEQYLERCIESCEKQDIPHEDYEVIIVNDDSSDNTLQVANNLAEKYSNIIVLSQDNQGQSVARNLGIEHAKGDYIWFVDSDDYIDENCLSSLLDDATLEMVDILLFRLKKSTDYPNVKSDTLSQTVEFNKVYAKGELLIAGYNVGTICDAFFKRDFILNNQLRFVPNLIHEDAEFSMRAMAFALSVKKVNKFPYTYYIREGSTITSTSIEKVVKREVDNVRIAKMIKVFANEQIKKGMSEDIVNNLLARSQSMYIGEFVLLLRNRKKWRKQGVNRRIIEQLKQIGLFPLKSSSFRNWKHRIFVKFIINNTWIYE